MALILLPALLSQACPAQDAFHSFNPDQRIHAQNRIRKVTIRKNGDVRKQMHLDEQGRIARVVYFDEAGDTASLRLVRYDSAGKVTGVTTDTSGGRIAHRFYYDSGHRIASIYTKDGTGEHYRVYRFSSEGKVLSEFRDDVETATAVYNSNGRMEVYSEKDRDGMQKKMVTYQYDSRGLLLKRTVLSFEEGRLRSMHTEVFARDGRGRITQVENEAEGWVKGYFYNERGLLQRIEKHGAEAQIIVFEYAHFAE